MNTSITEALNDPSLVARTVEQAFLHPADQPEMAALLYAMVAVAFALLVVFALMLATPSKRKVVKVRRYVGEVQGGAPPAPSDTSPPADAPVPEAAPRRSWLTGPAANVIVVTLAVAGVIGTYGATSLDAYCGETCHSTAVAGRVHDGAMSCRDCHEAPLVTGAVANVVSRTRMAIGYASGSSPASEAVVASSACVRCHDDILDDTVITSRGLAVAHEHFTASGTPCTRCHARIGHAKSNTTVSMSDCVVCHDTRTASAECETCHRQDPVASAFRDDRTGKVSGTGAVVYPVARAANRRCTTCHDMEERCDPCHGGIRMPHTRGFIEGEHAVAAAYDRKLTCFKCHDPVDCGQCHGGFNPTSGQSTHGAAWKSEHKTSRWNAGCVCHDKKSARTAPICFRCHETDRSLKPIRQ